MSGGGSMVMETNNMTSGKTIDLQFFYVFPSGLPFGWSILVACYLVFVNDCQCMQQDIWNYNKNPDWDFDSGNFSGGMDHQMPDNSAPGYYFSQCS